MRKKKVTLEEVFEQNKPNQNVIEELAGIPKGTIRQYLHGRPVTTERLKKIQKGLSKHGKSFLGIELIQKKEDDES